MTKKRQKELISTTKSLFIYRFRRTIDEAKMEGATEEEIFEILRQCFPDTLTPTIPMLYDWFTSGAATRVANVYERRLPEQWRIYNHKA